MNTTMSNNMNTKRNLIARYRNDGYKCEIFEAEMGISDVYVYLVIESINDDIESITIYQNIQLATLRFTTAINIATN